MQIQPHHLIPLCRALDARFGDIEPRDAVAQHHVQRRRGAAFLTVRRDGDAIEPWAPEEEAFDLGGVAVIVEVDGAVGREQGVEIVVGERVRVISFETEDHQIGDVDDAHASGGDVPP